MVSEEVPQEILARISGHLRSANALLGTRADNTAMNIERAQTRIEGLLGELPLKGEYPQRTAVAHLEEANALAEEHLEVAGLTGQIRRAVREALSEAREEL